MGFRLGADYARPEGRPRLSASDGRWGFVKRVREKEYRDADSWGTDANKN